MPKKLLTAAQAVQYLHDSGYSWADIAYRTGVSRATPLRIARGQTPKVELRDRLFELYAVRRKECDALRRRIATVEKEAEND